MHVLYPGIVQGNYTTLDQCETDVWTGMLIWTAPGTACHFNGSKSEKYRKICRTTVRILCKREEVLVDHQHTWHEMTKQIPERTQRALSGRRQIQRQIEEDNDLVLAE